MISTDQGHSVWVSDFETQEEKERFEGVETSVNEVACRHQLGSAIYVPIGSVLEKEESITHEEVVCVGDVAANAEQLHQVMELAMNISTYLFTALVRCCLSHLLPDSVPYRDRRRDRHHIPLFDE